MMRAAVVAPLLGLFGLVTPQPHERFPGANWERAVPEDVGMSSELLEAALDYAGGLLGGRVALCLCTPPWLSGRRAVLRGRRELTAHHMVDIESRRCDAHRRR